MRQLVEEVREEAQVAEQATTPRIDHDQIVAEARLVGLRQFRTPTLEAVEKRRVQLWFVSVLMLLGVTAIVTAGSFFPEALNRLGIDAIWFARTEFRLLMGTLTLGFAAYVYEKERHLRRLTRLLVDERVLTAALSNRLAEVSTLLEAGKAINSVLDLDSVLHIIVNSATTLLEASGGAILMAVPGTDELEAVCVHGSPLRKGTVVKFDDGVVGRVARNWEPMLVSSDDVRSSMCVPLIHRSQLLGVLTLEGNGDRNFTEYDLRALSLFAEQAAAAIANARLYELEREHVTRLVENNVRKSEFLAAVSHDLRTPLTSLTGCTKMLQRTDLNDRQRGELLAMIDRQTDRLRRMIEDMLASARIEAETPPDTEPVDIAPLLRELAHEYDLSGHLVSVSVPPTLVVLGRADGLRRILTNLIDNAFKHGAPPVSVTANGHGHMVVIEVDDRGPGVPVEDRVRIFDRFTRLDANRQIPGMGLGLSIVQGLAAGFGGEATAGAGADGQGTVITVRLRAA